MKNNKMIIGIDPDTDKSGVAFYWTESKELILHNMSLWELFENLNLYRNLATVRLEAGHKMNNTWHKGGNGMAKRVGANNEIGRQIEKYCLEHKIHLELVKPCGFSSFNHDRFCQVTNWDKKVRTNPETRVAGLLVYGY